MLEASDAFSWNVLDETTTPSYSLFPAITDIKTWARDINLDDVPWSCSYNMAEEPKTSMSKAAGKIFLARGIQ